MAGAYLAISCLTSAMTRAQVVSFILAVVICLFLILCGFDPVINMLEGVVGSRVVEFVASFSFVTHFADFEKGVLDSRNVIYFLSVIAFSLFTTSVVLRGHRAG
jgi:ABC-2 type transport system permease protein